VDTLAADLFRTLGGVLRLQREAFSAAFALPHPALIGIAVVLGAALSEALSQSVVLFANRVKPGRFVLSLAVNALLLACGYAFAIAATWSIAALPGQRHIGLPALALVFALSSVPLLFAFLGALPYLGQPVLSCLRIWHLLALVVGVGAVAHVSLLTAFSYAGFGWVVLVIVQQTFGKPVAVLGERILDAAAGVDLTDSEQVAVDRRGPSDRVTSVTGVTVARAAGDTLAFGALKHSNRWRALTGIGAMACVFYIVALTLRPVHQAIFSAESHVPRYLHLPFDLAWVALVGIIVAGFMAPVETLGWWAGWYGDEVDTKAKEAQAKGGDDVTRFVVYLDGIAQSSDRYTPDVETFLDALAPLLPQRVRLVRGIMTYSVLNRPLDDDPMLAWFWSFVDKLRIANPANLLGMFVNLRNVFIVAVSADQRYGPLYNYGIAQIIYDALIANGYRTKSGTPLTLIGYSGGGQMSAASASFLRRALDAPVDVISLGGVISGDCRILELEHLYHFVGEKDGVERFGRVMFPSRWKISVLSFWNRAVRLGRLTQFSLGPVGHQVPGGMLDPAARLPDGRTFLQQTLDYITQILQGQLETAPPDAVREASNYERYVQAEWNRPEFYPLAAPVDEEHFRPVGEWIGRLILPSREERTAVGGAWFEVHHADGAHRALAGTTVKLRWSSEPRVRAFVRAVTRDVHFSAQAEYTSRYGGLIQPVRLNHRQLVDPLESLAGSRPLDDMLVMLAGPVTFDEAAGVVTISREPVQIAGRYYGLVRLLAPLEGDRFAAVHFNRATRAFDGPGVTLRLPQPVRDVEGREPSSLRGLEGPPPGAEGSEPGAGGWYVYGAPDAQGLFVVTALAPRALLRLQPERTLSQGSGERYRYVRKRSWPDLVARKGGTLSVALGEDEWRAGDRALLVHVYGGIGGKQREAVAERPFYAGHFAFGSAEVVHDPLADELRFEIVYRQLYAHNRDGIVSGALHWSRYLGDRQFGWAGLRPVCDILLKADIFAGEPDDGSPSRRSPLGSFMLQLEALAARYRIGDGSGGTYVSPANNCAQDSCRALFATLRRIDRFEATGPAFKAWAAQHPADVPRVAAILGLARELRRRLQPLGAPRRDWTENEFNFGTTFEDSPFDQVRTALGSWRAIFPRMASDTIVEAFLRHGASAWVLGTDQLGDRPEIEPVVPFTL
jgi:predicted Abi (CAAX) family protease